jgi:uncharacterized protein (TIGR02271 family)
MEIDGRQFTIAEGMDVYGSDGDKVGSVVAVQPNYVVVEKGFFFPTDYYIPLSAISTFDDGKIFLNVSKDAALNQGWDAAPTDVAYATTDSYVSDADIVAGDAERVEAGTIGTAYAGTATVAEGETVRVPVHEEELTATKRPREVGAVRVEKDVVTEERTIDVPVTEERVRVERRVVDRPLDAADATAFEEGVIEVPIRGEEVELQKRVRVAEEVEIGKEAVQRTETVGGTVRREEVRVQEDVVDAEVQGSGYVAPRDATLPDSERTI